MKQWFDTLRYGDRATKRILWSMLIFSVLTIVCVVVALLRHRYMLLGPAFVCLAIAIVISQMYDFKELKADRLADFKKPVAPEDVLVRYTQKHIRQIFIRFRVKSDHRRILIDASVKYKISQTPGYVWVYRNQLHILLLEKEVRQIVLPLTQVGPVRYRRAVPVNPKGEYIQFRKPSLLSNVFSDYLPQVYERGQGGIKQQYKNLYMIGEDILITAKSAGQIMDLTGTGFVISDKLTESGEYGDDFIEMYQAYTLFRDQVLDANAYRLRVMTILENMAVSNMLDQELTVNLDKMQTFRFITPEYATYCLEKRVKLRNQNRKTR